MEDYYLHLYKDKINDVCAGCKFCEFDACLVSLADEYYHGYDSTSACYAFDNDMPETNLNRLWISLCWKKCSKFIKAEKDDYLLEFIMHIIYALSEFPDNTDGKTENEVIENVKSLYTETLKLYPSKKDIIYNKDFFEPILKEYNEFYSEKFEEHSITYTDLRINILNKFKEEYYD